MRSSQRYLTGPLAPRSWECLERSAPVAPLTPSPQFWSFSFQVWRRIGLVSGLYVLRWLVVSS
eukprot:9463030-Pyramimonas_sp.AAC.1